MLNTFENAKRQHLRKKERAGHFDTMERISKISRTSVYDDDVDATNLAPKSMHDDVSPKYHHHQSEQISSDEIIPRGSNRRHLLCRGKQTNRWWFSMASVGALLVASFIYYFPQETSPSSIKTIEEAPSHLHTYNRLESLILDWGVTTREDLSSTASPAYKALQWMVVQDKETSLSANVETLRTRFVLATFFYSTHKEQANVHVPWSIEMHWLSSFPVCLWHGVECFDRDDTLGLVKGVNLTANGLAGRIPKEISLLQRDLRYLDISYNSIAGTIPDLSPLQNLQRLYLGPNKFRTEIPESIYELKQLTHMYADGCSFTGNLSEAVGQLSSLKGLGFHDNLLTGPIPEAIGLLTNLKALYLDENNLTGSIPRTIGKATDLLDIRFHDNRLQGTLPSELGDLKLLQILYLDQNMLSGAIPTRIGELALLREIHLYQNHLTGSLPVEMFSLLLLGILYLDDNRFHGSIPTEVGNLRFLENFFLFDNYLNGKLPSQMGEMSSLRTFASSNNDLTGSIVSQIGMLENLEELYVDGNALVGTVPAALGELPQLRVLRLHGNQFTGSMPKGICKEGLSDLTADCSAVTCNCCTICYGQ